MENILDTFEMRILFIRQNIHYYNPNNKKMNTKCLYVSRNIKCDEDYLDEKFKTFYIPIEYDDEVDEIINCCTVENGDEYHFYACHLNGKPDRMFIPHTSFKMNVELLREKLHKLEFVSNEKEQEKMCREMHGKMIL